MIGTLSTLFLTLLSERYPRCVSDGDLRAGELLGGIMLAKKSFNRSFKAWCSRVPPPVHQQRSPGVCRDNHDFGLVGNETSRQVIAE
jgi:hypothetical protein